MISPIFLIFPNYISTLFAWPESNEDILIKGGQKNPKYMYVNVSHAFFEDFITIP